MSAGTWLRHATVQGAVFPKIRRHPTINRYEAGMHYGPHLDQPFMPGTVPTRADVSATVFLSDPSSYEGGELSIHSDPLPVDFKGQAGDAILYPSDSIHCVKEVRSGGVRVVAVTWFQSLIRDAAERKISFDLGTALRALESANSDAEARVMLRAAYQNLQRRWAESRARRDSAEQPGEAVCRGRRNRGRYAMRLVMAQASYTPR